MERRVYDKTKGHMVKTKVIGRFLDIYLKGQGAFVPAQDHSLAWFR